MRGEADPALPDGRQQRKVMQGGAKKWKNLRFPLLEAETSETLWPTLRLLRVWRKYVGARVMMWT